MSKSLRSQILLYSVLASLLYLAACTNGNVDDGTSSLSLNERELSSHVQSGGRVSFDFDLPPQAASFNLTARAGSGSINLLSLVSPTGHEISGLTTDTAFPGGQSSPLLTTVSFPFLNGSVEHGVYHATFQLHSSNAGQVQLTVTSKSDSDLTSGTLKVNIILAGAAAKSDDTKSSLEEALGKWKKVYDRAGIALDPQWYDFSDGPDTLPDPSQGSSYYTAISSATRPQAVNIVFGTFVEGLSNPVSSSPNRYGIAGGSPGPVMPGEKSAIALSIIALTGGDGVFDLPANETGSTRVNDDETRIAAEEMARLTANYLGLPDTLEFDRNTVNWTDPLSDTPSCLNLTSCRYDESARANFMLPFPLYKLDQSFENETYPRHKSTAEQSRVLNNSVLID